MEIFIFNVIEVLDLVNHDKKIKLQKFLDVFLQG